MTAGVALADVPVIVLGSDGVGVLPAFASHRVTIRGFRSRVTAIVPRVSIDLLAAARARTDADLAAGRPAASLVEEVTLGLVGLSPRSLPTTVRPDLVAPLLLAGEWSADPALA